jgi:hypothetical protein
VKEHQEYSTQKGFAPVRQSKDESDQIQIKNQNSFHQPFSRIELSQMDLAPQKKANIQI